MYTIAKRFAFSASHTIGGVPPEHPCARLHGHNYEVEVILQSASLDAIGFVRDYGELSDLKGFLVVRDGTGAHCEACAGPPACALRLLARDIRGTLARTSS